MREIIIEESNKYPGGIDAIHVQTEIERRLKEVDDRPRPPKLQAICEELEQMKDEGLLERLDDVPGANLSSTRVYAKPGTYPAEQPEGE
jgi:hypothetical protein